MSEWNNMKKDRQEEFGMKGTKPKVTNHYPEESFDSQKQKEWAKAIVDRLCVFAEAARTVPERNHRNDKWKQAV